LTERGKWLLKVFTENYNIKSKIVNFWRQFSQLDFYWHHLKYAQLHFAALNKEADASCDFERILE
jgi:hypothetical protein